MKRKVSLFMAGALALSTLPFNVFAASENTISNLFVSSSDVIYTNATTDASVEIDGDKYVVKSTDEAPVLRIELKDAMDAGEAFEVTLENGEWLTNEEAGTDIYDVADAFVAGATVSRQSDKTIRVTMDAPIAKASVGTIEVPVLAKLEGGEAITLTIDAGSSHVTGGTYALTNQVEGDLAISGENGVLEMEEEIAGSLNVNEPLVLEMKGSKAEWVSGDVVAKKATDFGLTEETTLTGVTVVDEDELNIDLSADLKNNESGFGETLKLDLSDVMELTDRDYEGTIDLYVYGAGIDKEDKVAVTIYDLTQDLKVTVSEDSEGTVEQLVSGRVGQETSTVEIEELTDGSLRDDRYIKLELSKGAKFNGAQTITFGDADKEDVVIAPEEDAEELYIDKNTVEFDADALNTIEFTPEINVAAEYTGDVTMTISGPGITEEIEVVIAQTVSPITIETEVSFIKAGFTNIPTADITVTENYAGALETGSYEFVVGDDQGISADSLKIAAVEDGVIEGDELEVEVLEVENTSGAGIEVDVLSETEEEAGSFTVTGIEIYADSTVPTSKEAFELTFQGINTDELAIGYDFDYITTGNIDGETTPGNSINADLNTNVGITLGETAYTIDGVYAGELQAAPYVSNSSSVMVSTRALSNALGVPAENILWHQASQTVTIIVSEDRIAQFTVGSDIVTINGIQYPIVSATGQTDVVEVKDGYTFLPIRFLGEKVFGVSVDWDNTTQTAIFNAK